MRDIGNKRFKLCGQALLFGGLSLVLPRISLAADYNVVVNGDGLVSMYGQNVAVEELMSSLGEELDIIVSFPTPVTDKVTVDFQELKLEQAIKQVTQSYILVSNKVLDDHTIKEIIVMPEGEASAYLPEEGDIKQQLIQDAEAAGLPPLSDEDDRKSNRAKMLERIANIKSKTRVEVEESRLAIELEQQIGDGVEPPVEMD